MVSSPRHQLPVRPGDSGKSTILEAIDCCLGARRNIQFTDADFHQLDVESPIIISATIGELDDALRNLDTYGMYVRGFHQESGQIDDEPERGAETVLTIRMTVGGDLEPAWSLVSERAEAQEHTRDLSWADRLRLSPTKIGVMADYHLGWRRGSVLNRVSEERADASAALAKAARDARLAFGNEANDQLSATLEIVAATAKELGIPIGANIKALLDATSVSFSGGTISLHDEDGIPLRGLGIGSTRLLIAGLQRKAASQSTIILIDEVEHGLEPHRIIRLLGSLGAKEEKPPLQVFMATHSPVAIRELSGNQLAITRPGLEKHEVLTVGTANDIQSSVRLYPDAFLAHSVIICEGASEVGLVRGIDQYRISNGHTATTAHGTALVDCGGGDADMPFKRASAFRALGFRVAVIRDNDIKPTNGVAEDFTASGGTVIAWREGRALEDELFSSLPVGAVIKLIDRAIEIHGEESVNAHVTWASDGAKDLNAIQTEAREEKIGVESRQILAKAARRRKTGWFKSVTWMEKVASEIVGPDLPNADAAFTEIIDAVFAWASNGAE